MGIYLIKKNFLYSAMKFVVALFLSTTSAITLNQLQQLRSAAKDCTGTTAATCLAPACTFANGACAAALSQGCAGKAEADCTGACAFANGACGDALSQGCAGKAQAACAAPCAFANGACGDGAGGLAQNCTGTTAATCQAPACTF